MKKALTTDLSVSAGRNYRPADPEIGGGKGDPLPMGYRYLSTRP